jgi:hypothetical protein
MKRTFLTEDSRKTKLFEAWNQYLQQTCLELEGEIFDEIYEGSAMVSDISKNRIGFHLKDGRKLRHIPITPEISESSSRLDHAFLTLGRREGSWRVLFVVSIGSIIPGKRGGAHITVNPLLVDTKNAGDFAGGPH